MTVHSGVSGIVNGYSTVIKWMVDHTVEESEAVTASNSYAGQISEGGVDDWRGHFIGKGHTPGVFPGDSLAFIGDTGNTKGVSGTAMCEKLEITGDVEANHAIQYRVDFSRNGVLSLGAAPAADSSSPAIYLPTSLAVYFDGTKLTDTRYYRLILANEVCPYCDSETAGGRLRTRGAMSGAFQVKAYVDDPSTLPIAGVYYTGKFYVTVATYWSVAYLHVLNVTDLGADHNSKENVGAVISGVFSAFDGTAVGSIKDPSTATKWPFSE